MRYYIRIHAAGFLEWIFQVQCPGSVKFYEKMCPILPEKILVQNFNGDYKRYQVTELDEESFERSLYVYNSELTIYQGNLWNHYVAFRSDRSAHEVGPWKMGNHPLPRAIFICTLSRPAGDRMIEHNEYLHTGILDENSIKEVRKALHNLLTEEMNWVFSSIELDKFCAYLEFLNRLCK